MAAKMVEEVAAADSIVSTVKSKVQDHKPKEAGKIAESGHSTCDWSDFGRNLFVCHNFTI